MKPLPPQHVILPVLTERLQPDDAITQEHIAAPFEAQPSAYADAVYRDPDDLLPVTEVDAPAIDTDQLWAQIAPVLQQRLQEQVRAELDALAPQIAARVFLSIEQTLRDFLSDAVKQR